MKTRRALSRIFSTSVLAALLLRAAPAFAEPQVETSLSDETAAPGAPVTLSVDISWKGDPEQYIIAPPQPELPDGIEQISSSFSSSARENEQRMQYRFVLRAAGEGAYTLKPVAVKYWARGQSQESTATGPEISFKAVRFSVLRNTGAALTAGAAGLAIAAVCAGLLIIRKKRRQITTAARAPSPSERIAQLLQTCRTSKLSGDYSLFYESAISLCELMPGQEGVRQDTLPAALEQVRFGGLRPPAEDVERLLRQLEKGAEKIASAEAGKPDYQKYCK